MPLHFNHPEALLLLLLLPLLWIAHWHGKRRRAAALTLWSAAPVLRYRSLRIALQSAAIAALALALADPASRVPASPSAAHGTADIVFLVDVSRSMLAADVAPNRLAHAKAIVRQIAAQDRGNRVALVAFAGGQSVACPLTVDRSFFAEALDDLSPESVARGGTRIGDAIRFALDRVLDDVRRDRRTFVVISDGEDHESSPEAAAADAARDKVNVVSIGVGVEAGAPVPVSATDATPFLYRGEPVRSRLDPDTLRSLAKGGAYLDANRTIDAAAIHRQWLAPAGPGSAPAESSNAAWTALLALAIALVAIDPPRNAGLRACSSTMLAVLLVLHPFTANAQTIEEWYKRGQEALDKHEYVDAMRYFAAAARWAPDIAEVRFNLARSLYGFQAFGEAAMSFEHAAKIAASPHLQAQARLGQGNSFFRDATSQPNRPDNAIPRLRAAIDAYRTALKLEPGLFAADINLKVAERRLRDFQQRSSPDEPAPSAEAATADQILREAHRPAVQQTLAIPSGVDKDW